MQNINSTLEVDELRDAMRSLGITVSQIARKVDKSYTYTMEVLRQEKNSTEIVVAALEEVEKQIEERKAINERIRRAARMARYLTSEPQPPADDDYDNITAALRERARR